MPSTRPHDDETMKMPASKWWLLNIWALRDVHNMPPKQWVCLKFSCESMGIEAITLENRSDQSLLHKNRCMFDGASEN